MTFSYLPAYASGMIAVWYLKQSQFPLYEMLQNKRRVVTNCRRRFGKDTTTLVYVCERCITEKIIVRYGAPTIRQAYEILDITLDHIFAYDATYKPRKSIYGYTFPNGSRIILFGGKDSTEIEKGRGTECDVCILSEFGFFKHRPEYLIESILQPQLLTTEGQMIILSTPPLDMTHRYIKEVQEAEANGYLFKHTILDSLACGDISESTHKLIIEDCHGVESIPYRREYLCELVADTSVLVIPEAQDEYLFVGSQERPPYYDYYLVADLGLSDFYAAMFGYVDFVNARIVIEDEIMINYKTTKEIVEICRAKEQELAVKMYMRYADSNDAQQLFDMCKDYKYSISPITKRSEQSNIGYRQSVINGLRVAITNKRLLIHPRCKNTITQLKYGIYNDSRTDFERSDKMGHLDCLMACAYFVDNANMKKNPYPLHGGNTIATHHIENIQQKTKEKETLKKIFVQR